jgi:hypothetical protein
MIYLSSSFLDRRATNSRTFPPVSVHFYVASRVSIGCLAALLFGRSSHRDIAFPDRVMFTFACLTHLRNDMALGLLGPVVFDFGGLAKNHNSILWPIPMADVRSSRAVDVRKEFLMWLRPSVRRPPIGLP